MTRPLQDTQDDIYQLVLSAQTEPQVMTYHEEPMAVVVSMKLFKRMVKGLTGPLRHDLVEAVDLQEFMPKRPLIDFLMELPLQGIDLSRPGEEDDFDKA